MREREREREVGREREGDGLGDVAVVVFDAMSFITHNKVRTRVAESLLDFYIEKEKKIVWPYRELEGVNTKNVKRRYKGHWLGSCDALG